MNIYSSWLEKKANRSRHITKWTKSLGIEEQRLYEIVKLQAQFEKCLGIWNRHLTTEDEKAIKVEKKLLEKRKSDLIQTKRKFLKLDEDIVDGSDEDINDAEESVTAMEFRLNHNPHELIIGSDVNLLNHKELTLIKLTICLGLYPNIAIPDEANYSRPPDEQFYHTKLKRFFRMSPSSVFSSRPELLSGSSKNKQSIICYLNLLETSKPCIIHPIVLPSISFALLIAHKVLISPDCMHLVVDDWLNIEFLKREDALVFLFYIVYFFQRVQVAIFLGCYNKAVIRRCSCK
jgi:hypothetical protein